MLGKRSRDVWGGERETENTWTVECVENGQVRGRERKEEAGSEDNAGRDSLQYFRKEKEKAEDRQEGKKRKSSSQSKAGTHNDCQTGLDKWTVLVISQLITD